MITNQLMKRKFFNTTITQRTKDSYFNATELLKVHNSISNTTKVIAEFWSNKKTKEFLSELANEVNIGKSPHSKTTLESDLYTTSRGGGGGTYMHPYLFVKFAMWLSPKFEVQVIKWVYDNLIDFRNQAGDNYREMGTAIMETYKHYYKKSPSPLIYSSEARFLNELVKGRHITGERNDLNEKELSLLNNLQKLNISLLRNITPVNDRKKALRDYAEMYKVANF